jgi:hypothetical protein
MVFNINVWDFLFNMFYRLPKKRFKMNNEYVIINKTELEAKIAELESIPMYEKQWEDLDSITSEIRALKQTLSQSTPLIPEIEKAYWDAINRGEDISSETSNSLIKDYISNLKLDI